MRPRLRCRPSNLNTLLETIPPYWEAGRKIFYQRMGDPTTPEGKAQLDATVAAELAPTRSRRRCWSSRAPTIRASTNARRIRS